MDCPRSSDHALSRPWLHTDLRNFVFYFRCVAAAVLRTAVGRWSIAAAVIETAVIESAG